MNEYFGIKEMTLTESELQSVRHFDLSPIARQILKDANLSWANDLLSSDPDKAADATRQVLRESFTIIPG